MSFAIDTGVRHEIIMVGKERNENMSKILFMNGSPNKNGNTNRIGEALLQNIDHDVLQMSDYRVSQYGNVYADDQIGEIFKALEDKDTIVIGAPVYWYTVGGILLIGFTCYQKQKF